MNDIVTFPDTLAERAHDAIRAYAVGIAKHQKGREEVIAAIVEYGKALLEGRAKYASDKLFAQWVEANNLDKTKPFDKRQDRTSAMNVAEIISSRKIPATNFFACTNTRPDDIMKWTRKQPWFAKKVPAPTKSAVHKRKSSSSHRIERPTTGPLAAKTQEELWKLVDPEFTGTPTEFVDKYGHVQIMTAEQYATMRYSDWALAMRSLAKVAKGMPKLPEVDYNWLRSPKTRDVGWMTEALDVLRPLIAEAEALLERVKKTKELA